MMWGYGWMGVGMLWAGLLLVVLVIAGIAVLLIPILGRNGGHDRPTDGGSALDILARRYARGEIDQATYEQMRERLQGMVTERREQTPSTR